MAEAEDARALCKGSYSAWMKKVKSDGAKVKWISSMTKRYFTIDFDSQLFFYSHSEDQKKVSQPIRFKEIVGAERLPPKKKLRKGSHDCGFVLRTTERNFELYTTSNPDAVQWVHALNGARDIVAKEAEAAAAVVAAVETPPGSSPKAAQTPPGSSPKSSKSLPAGSPKGSPKAELVSAPLWAIEKPPYTDGEACAENSAGDEDTAGAAATAEEAPQPTGDSAASCSKAATPEAAAVETPAAEAQPLLQQRPRAPKVLPSLSLRPGTTPAPGPLAEHRSADQPQQEAKLLVTRPGARRSADLESQAAPLLEAADRDAKPNSTAETPCLEEAVDEPQHVSTPLSKLTGELRSPFTDASSPAAPAAAVAQSTGAACRGQERTPSIGINRSVVAEARIAAECSAAAQTSSASTTVGPCDFSAASLEYSAGSGSLRDSLVSQRDDKGVLLLPSEEDTESSAVASTAVGSETLAAAAMTVPQSARAQPAAAAHSAAADEEAAKKAAEEKAEAEATAKKAAEEKAAAEAAERKAAEEKVGAEAAAKKAAEEKAAAEAAERKAAEEKAEAEAAAKEAAEAAERKAAEEKAEAEALAKKAAEEKAATEAAERKVAEEKSVAQEAAKEAKSETAGEGPSDLDSKEAKAPVARKAKSENAEEEPSGWDSEEEVKAPLANNASAEREPKQDESAGWDSEEETEAVVPPAGSPQDHKPAEEKSTCRFKQEMKEALEEEEPHEEPSGWDSDHESEAQPANATATKDSPLSPSGWDDSDEDSSDDDEATPLKDAACGAPQQPVQDFAKAKPAIGEMDELVGMVLAADANTPYKMGSTGGSYGFVPGLQCTGCDSQVLRVEKKVWNKDANYMFFRNNYPNVMKLRKNLEPRQSCVAYCCQCSWKSAEADAVLEDVCQGLRWRLVSA